MLDFRKLALSLLLLVGANSLRAQCPDGSPPPCRGARRAGPSLNEREYIVVPFANVTRAQDLDWLKDASVNLLTLEVGRWNSVEVVNDKRVGDLLRELPAASRDGLTLNDGLSLARRAGAGMLVMGDFYKQGRGARLVANVFDVRTGNRVRTAQQQTTDPDSLLNAFGPLARGVLDVPAPADSRTGDIGTTNLDAYQVYLLGVRALNRFDLDAAQTHLRHALALDSTFALAHLQLSMMLGWAGADRAGEESVAHAQAAQRFGSALPPRERGLIAAQLGVANGDYDAACIAAKQLVDRDSSDVQALYLLGDCSFHDRVVIPGANDTMPGRLRWSLNLSYRSLIRAVTLDPSFHQAYGHILDLLEADNVFGCALRPGSGDCDQWVAAVLRDGDSLLIQPVSFNANGAAYGRQMDRAFAEKPLIANLRQAEQVAQRWVAADPDNDRARSALATVLMREGDLASADAQLRRVNSRAYDANYPVLRARLEVAAKLGRGTEARMWFDSLVKAIPDAPSNAVMRGSIDMLFGRTRRATNGLATNLGRFGPEASEYGRHVPRVMLGLPDTALGRVEQAWWGSMLDSARCALQCRMTRLQPSLVYGIPEHRASWVPFPRGDMFDERWSLAQAIALGDTARLRRATVDMDSSARHNVAMGWMENGWMVVAAQGYLALHDSAAALRSARFYVDSAMAAIPVSQGSSGQLGSAPLWVRMMLMRADLAAAARSKDEARTWYDRVLDLWANADQELQPEVARIRTSRDALAR